MNDLPIYPPSTVQDFAFCQQLRDFKRTGWVPRIANRRMIAASWSIAAHAGLAHFHRTGSVEQAGREARVEWQAEVQHHQTHGVNYGVLNVEEMSQALVKFTDRYAKESLLLHPGWTVLSVEREFPAFGHARVDIVAQDPDGFLVPVDFKIKREITSKWFDIQGWCDEFAHSWNQLHYMYALEQERAEDECQDAVEGMAFGPCAYRPVTRHYIYGLTAKPWDQLLVPFDISDAYRKWWLESSRRQWNAMGMIHEQNLSMNMHPTHRNQYGTCDFLKACTLQERKPAMMALDYVQVPRRYSQEEIE